MRQLRDYLSSIPAGEIVDVGHLDATLAQCWHEFHGADAEGMAAYKLLGRMEQISWNPPELSFRIERHGGTVLGSTRAELLYWSVNLETRTATCATGGRRQLEPMQPGLNVKPIAEEIVALIDKRQHDGRLKWNADGSVQVVIGKIIPGGSAVKQTLEGRRRRFREEVERLLTNLGWQKVRANVYAPPP